MKKKENFDYVVRFNIKEEKYELFKQYKKGLPWNRYYKDVKVEDNEVCLKYEVVIGYSGHLWHENHLLREFSKDYSRHQSFWAFMNHNIDDLSPDLTLDERGEILNKAYTQTECLEFVDAVNNFETKQTKEEVAITGDSEATEIEEEENFNE